MAVVAKMVRISKASAEQILAGDFDPSVSYYPGVAGRKAWFKKLRVICPPLTFAPPLTFDGAFIQLSEQEETARQALEDIAGRQDRPYLANCIRSNWQLDHRGYIKAALACRLLCYAQHIKSLRGWFDIMLQSDSHDVSYSAFEKHVGWEKIKAFREDTANNDDRVKSMLPTLP